MKKTAIVVIVNLGSRNIRKSGNICEAGFFGSRDLISRLARIRVTTQIKATTRVAQAQPIMGNNFSNTSGNTMPPAEPPVVAIPVAIPRFLLKKCPMAETEGVSIREAARPPARPIESIKCQYSWQNPSETVITIAKIDPMITRSRGPLVSNIGPIWAPQKKVRNAYMPKIQPVVPLL